MAQRIDDLRGAVAAFGAGGHQQTRQRAGGLLLHVLLIGMLTAGRAGGVLQLREDPIETRRHSGHIAAAHIDPVNGSDDIRRLGEALVCLILAGDADRGRVQCAGPPRDLDNGAVQIGRLRGGRHKKHRQRRTGLGQLREVGFPFLHRGIGCRHEPDIALPDTELSGISGSALRSCSTKCCAEWGIRKAGVGGPAGQVCGDVLKCSIRTEEQLCDAVLVYHPPVFRTVIGGGLDALHILTGGWNEGIGDHIAGGGGVTPHAARQIIACRNVAGDAGAKGNATQRHIGDLVRLHACIARNVIGDIRCIQEIGVVEDRFAPEFGECQLAAHGIRDDAVIDGSRVQHDTIDLAIHGDQLVQPAFQRGRVDLHSTVGNDAAQLLTDVRQAGIDTVLYVH